MRGARSITALEARPVAFARRARVRTIETRAFAVTRRARIRTIETGAFIASLRPVGKPFLARAEITTIGIAFPFAGTTRRIAALEARSVVVTRRARIPAVRARASAVTARLSKMRLVAKAGAIAIARRPFAPIRAGGRTVEAGAFIASLRPVGKPFLARAEITTPGITFAFAGRARRIAALEARPLTVTRRARIRTIVAGTLFTPRFGRSTARAFTLGGTCGIPRLVTAFERSPCARAGTKPYRVFFGRKFVHASSRSSTSKTRVALGGITPPAPRAP
jgi:hypothetical protein